MPIGPLAAIPAEVECADMKHIADIPLKTLQTIAQRGMTYEPIRPLRAPDDGSAYYCRAVIDGVGRVDYGHSDWCSRSYWSVQT